MKKLSIIMTALAMLLAMTQCKKNDELNPAGTGSEPVNITLEVKGNDSGSKVAVDPSTGTVNFENGDAIYVASGGKYVGTLTYNGSVFMGAISNATEGAPLQFYFLGNVTPAETLTSGVTESCSVVISDQTQHLPVISAAPSNENYLASQPDYTAHLLNKCALVKFNVTTSSSAATCITGMNNKMTVNFSENTMTSSMEGAGLVKLSAGNGDKWAILLPQEALGEGESGSAYSEDFAFSGNCGAIPSIIENGYLPDGITVTVSESMGNVPLGAINGLFTINSNGDQVYFSQGNLQYQASTHTWRFADNQYDYIGAAAGNTTIDNRDTQSDWIDLFGWGTSGWNNGNTYFQPWNSDIGIGNEASLYGPPGDDQNLTGTYARSDWGVYNSISNGGSEANLWRTLTQNEWDYVINGRSSITDIRYAKAQVNGVNGVILLPDNWNSTYYNLSDCNNGSASFSTNVITSSAWKNSLESHGAVFLSTAGNRYNTNVRWFNGTGSDSGYYWSTSAAGGPYIAFSLYFKETTLRTNYYGFPNRGNGYSVRLVFNAN